MCDFCALLSVHIWTKWSSSVYPPVTLCPGQYPPCTCHRIDSQTSCTWHKRNPLHISGNLPMSTLFGNCHSKLYVIIYILSILYVTFLTIHLSWIRRSLNDTIHALWTEKIKWAEWPRGTGTEVDQNKVLDEIKHKWPWRHNSVRWHVTK